MSSTQPVRTPWSRPLELTLIRRELDHILPAICTVSVSAIVAERPASEPRAQGCAVFIGGALDKVSPSGMMRCFSVLTRSSESERPRSMSLAFVPLPRTSSPTSMSVFGSDRASYAQRTYDSFAKQQPELWTTLRPTLARRRSCRCHPAAGQLWHLQNMSTNGSIAPRSAGPDSD